MAEAVNGGLLEEGLIYERIPCLINADKTKLFVFLNKMSHARFNRTILTNLVKLASKVSPVCDQIIFICARSAEKPEEKFEVESNYGLMKQTLTVIDAERMTKSKLRDLIAAETFEATVERYGMYSLSI